MKILSFQLTMPNVGSWNGKWSGSEKKYYAIRKITDKSFKNSLPLSGVNLNGSDSFYYGFGDGWGADVTVELIDSKEANRRRKISAGFCGYEWMIESIMAHGQILNTNQRKQLCKPNNE